MRAARCPTWEEADGRRRLGIRQGRARDVEELTALLVAEPAQLEAVEGPLDLGRVHHAPGDDVAAGRGSERREVTTEHLRAGLGGVVLLGLVERHEPSLGRPFQSAVSW